MPEYTTDRMREAARRWLTERDAIVAADRFASSVFAAPGARRPGHEKFIRPMQACAEQVQALMPGDMSPAEWQAFTELVNVVNGWMIQRAGTDGADRAAIAAREPMDIERPETWDDDLSDHREEEILP